MTLTITEPRKGSPRGEHMPYTFIRTEHRGIPREKYDAAIVLAGCMIPPGVLDQESKDRTHRGIKLYQGQRVSDVILSGGRAQPQFVPTLADQMFVFASRRGLPSAWLEYMSLDTVGQFVFTLRDIVQPQGMQKIMVVTSDYHLKRSELIGELVYGSRYNLRYIGVPSEKRNDDAIRQAELQRLPRIRQTLDQTTPGDPESLVKALGDRHPLYKNVRLEERLVRYI